MKKIIGFTIIMLVSTTVMADNWTYLGNTDVNHKVYIDRTSITQNGNYGSLKIKDDVSQAITKDTNEKNTKDLIYTAEYDCTNGQFHIIDGIVHLKNGTVGKFDVKNWRLVPPNTPFMTFYKLACHIK